MRARAAVLLLASVLAPSAVRAQVDDGGTTPTSIPAAQSAVALLSRVRAASHPGFDRVVFEFENENRPAVSVEYVSPPFTVNPTGEEIAVRGSAFLLIGMPGASGFDLSVDPARQTYTGPLRIQADLPTVLDIVETSDFEAQLNWVLGLRGSVPFHVRVFGEPPRVVVDVAHVAVAARPVTATPGFTG
jgi:hypothetical protein